MSPVVQRPFLVHVLSNETTDAAGAGESVPLQRATKLCSDRPLIVACLTDGCVRARCSVPRHLVGNGFGAEQWLQTFASVLDGRIAEAQRGQSPDEIAVMKARKVLPNEYERLVGKAVLEAELFASSRLVKDDEQMQRDRQSDERR